jgi:integrase/recombinase XerC
MFRQSHYSTPKRLPEFLCEQEVDRLIDSVDNLRDKTILETLFATGCRPKELRSIQISKIDFESREIRVLGKDGHGAYVKERILLFTKRAGRLMQRYIPIREPKTKYQDILFLNSKGEDLNARELNQMVVGYIFKILGKKIAHPNGAYIIRHSFATAMMNRGVDLPYISEYLGHSNFSSVQIYTHTGIDRLIKVHKKCHPLENPPGIYQRQERREGPSAVSLEWAKKILKKA